MMMMMMMMIMYTKIRVNLKKYIFLNKRRQRTYLLTR